MNTVPELYNPTRALTEDFRSYFYERRHDTFILNCIEGDVEIQGNWMLLNMLLTMPLIKRRRPISRDKHLHLSGIYDASVHAEIMTRVSRSLEEVGYTREDLGHDIIMSANNMLNLCYTHLGNHIRTMDIFSIADTILQSEVKDVCTMDYGDLTDRNIIRMETAFKEQSEKMYQYLSTSSSNYNIFLAPLLCNALKKGQFVQFIISAGPKTDTDDQVFLRPVVGSFLSGLTGIQDLAIESRSAAKATHYNKTQMANTQYDNRKLHIQGSVMWHLYKNEPGQGLHDCGSTVYMEYEINKETVYHYLGKFYLDAVGVLVELTEDRFADVINKTVKMRDVQGCRYTDGYCEMCGGTITHSFSEHGNVGFLSNVNTGAPIAQQVLSTKHLTSTDAAEYAIPDPLLDVLMSINNNVFLRPAMRNKTDVLVFGFQPKDISYINDLKYVIDETQLHAAYFTDIKYMYVGLMKEDGTITKSTRTPMGGDSKVYPHLSPEVLSVIRQYNEDIEIQDGIAWLKLKHIDLDFPIMQCSVVNNSIKRFVNQFRDLITKDVERYRSMNDFMRVLTKLVWHRVGTHITHISCLARSCLVTSKTDFHIPVVEDMDNVIFGKLLRNIPMRSIGGLMAFQSIDMATNKPVTYITSKRHGIFDEFMGYQDTIERDRHWPVGYDKLEEEPLTTGD